MKLLLVGLYFLYSTEALKCVQEENADPLTCLGDGIDVCSQPKFIEYTGISVGKYTCGGCVGDTKDVTCSECSNDGCNVPAETAEDFKCFHYAWNLTEKAWVKETESSTCYRLKDTTIKCNMPGTAADADYSFPHNGCGPCATDAAKNTCVECDTEKCNVESSATTFTATLLPLIAVIYSLVM